MTLNLTPQQVGELKRLGIIPISNHRKHFKPDIGEKYFYANKSNPMDIKSVKWKNTDTNKNRRMMGNCFSKPEVAMQYMQYQQALVRLWDYADEHCDTDVNWSDGENKSSVRYSNAHSKWYAVSHDSAQYNFLLPHFTSEADAEKLKDNCTAELDIIRAYANR